MRVMDAKLSTFISQTGADPALARDLLQGNDWNVENAVRVYKLMQNSALPPSGPPKNVEPKRNNLVTVASTGGGLPGTGAAVGRPMVVAQKGGIVSGTVGTTILPVQQMVAPPSPNNSITRKLKRGLSKTTENIQIVNQARDLVLHDIKENVTEYGQHFVETPDLTFVLPDLTVYSEDFRAFLHKDLIETSTLVSLEQAGRLNWWADMGACQRLLPLATTGDGNCLLHAASLGMWGFHDRLLTLRKALYTTLTTSPAKGALWRRWRWHQTQANKESGLMYSESEWQTEWENLLKLASTKPRTTPGSNTSCCSGPATKGLMERTVERETDSDSASEVFYESLEEFHVFVLAHVLRRPIIIVADTILKDSNGEALAPIPFGGIYLPLECAPDICHRTPLLLTYDASHFSALVAMEQDISPDEKPGPPAAIPLVDPEFRLLPIHYLVDPGMAFVWGRDENEPERTCNLELSADDCLNVIKRYLPIERIAIPRGANIVQQPGLLVAPGDTDQGQQPRSRSNSQSGSVDSDENNSIGSSGSIKDKEKSKVAKQMQTVAKSFGSIGKTMSKKLKKNFGGVGKSGRLAEDKVKEKEKKRIRRTSVGSVTQSTKLTSVTVEMLRDREHILCVCMSHKRTDYQEEMVRNYLLAAQERFKQDRELRRQQDVEMRLKVELRSNKDGGGSLPPGGASVRVVPPVSDTVDGVLSPRVQCINPGCGAKGSASTSYLCPACYEKEKKQAIDFERGPIAADGRPILGGAAMPFPPVERQDTLVTSGKSKFYTLTNEEHLGSSSHVSLPQHPVVRDLSDGGELNNAKLLRDKKNSYLNTAAGYRVSRSTFYEEAPPEYKTVAVPPPASKPALPPGTTYIMNDLHNQPQGRQSMMGTAQPANGRLFGTVPTADFTTEPPLRPEFQDRPTGGQRPTYKVNPASHNLNEPITKQDMTPGPGQPLPPAGMGKCRTADCQFYGTDSMDFLCSACYRQKQQHLVHHTGKTQMTR